MSKHKNKKMFSGSLISDAKSKITRSKEFNDQKYKLYTTCPNSKKAHDIRKRLIVWLKKNTSYSRREKNLPVVYDTTWHGKNRFKVYIPKVWEGVPDV